MTPKQAVAAALRTNEYKLLAGRGWQITSTERQLQNGTIRLERPRHPLREITITTTPTLGGVYVGRISSNRHTYMYTAGENQNKTLREGLQVALVRTLFGEWK